MNPTLKQELHVWNRTPHNAETQQQVFALLNASARDLSNASLYWRRWNLLHRDSPRHPAFVVAQLNALDNEITRRKRAGTLKTKKNTGAIPDNYERPAQTSKTRKSRRGL